MKVKYDEDGYMVLTPETWREDEELKTFYLSHKTDEVRKVILFNRKK